MKTLLFTILACSLFLNTAAAQTPPIDDCPAGAELHRSLTALDDSSMLAAYTASFVGLFHRAPSMQPGSGADDGNYWIKSSNHYGLYGDNICRAGWNLYRERQLGSLPTGPKDGDLPASFLPGAPTPTPTPVPTPTPTPAPLPSVDLSGVLQQISLLSKQVDVVKADVDAGRAENQAFFSNVKSAWETYGLPLLKYVAPALGAYVTCHATGKC